MQNVTTLKNQASAALDRTVLNSNTVSLYKIASTSYVMDNNNSSVICKLLSTERKRYKFVKSINARMLLSHAVTAASSHTYNSSSSTVSQMLDLDS